jgi:signal transduction histidine kinase
MALLRVITGTRRGTSFTLEKGGVGKTLGRGEGADFILADKAVSRRHTEVFFREEQWFISDAESANGTFLNEQRVTESLPLKNNDQVRCGATVLLFEGDPTPWILEPPKEEKTAPIELEFDPGETMVAIAFDTLQSKQSAKQRQRFLQAGQAALNLSHGIKNILQAVNTGKEIVDRSLAEGQLDTARKGWNILKRNLDQIQKLVLDMLKFSKDQDLKIQACQFNRLVENAVQIAQSQAQLRSVAVVLQLDEQIGLVHVDPDRMQDVILNLALNAVEAVEPDKGHVAISTEIDPARNMLVLRISDNGPGIDDLSSLFEPFHSTKGQMGVGLGLAIVRKVVIQHKGTVDAQSIPGQGSIFTVRLPYLPVEMATMA